MHIMHVSMVSMCPRYKQPVPNPLSTELPVASSPSRVLLSDLPHNTSWCNKHHFKGVRKPLNAAFDPLSCMSAVSRGWSHQQLILVYHATVQVRNQQAQVTFGQRDQTVHMMTSRVHLSINNTRPPHC